MLQSLTLSFLCIPWKLVAVIFQWDYVLSLMIPTSRGCNLFPEGTYSQVIEGPERSESIHLLRRIRTWSSSSDLRIHCFAIRQTHSLTVPRAFWLLINNTHRESVKHCNAQRSSLPSDFDLLVSTTSKVRLGRFKVRQKLPLIAQSVDIFSFKPSTAQDHLPLHDLAYDFQPSPVLSPRLLLPVCRIIGDSGKNIWSGSLYLANQSMTRNRRSSGTSEKGAQDAASAFVRHFLTEVEGAGKSGLMYGNPLAIERDRYDV